VATTTGIDCAKESALAGRASSLRWNTVLLVSIVLIVACGRGGDSDAADISDQFSEPVVADTEPAPTSSGQPDSASVSSDTRATASRAEVNATVRQSSPSPEYPDDATYITYASTTLITPDGQEHGIGAEADTALRDLRNVEVEDDLMAGPGPRFGPIEGYRDTRMTTAWNNQDRIVYLEPHSPDVATADGLHLGSTREEVLATLGTPQARMESHLRYLCIDLGEPVWLTFDFDAAAKVTRLVSFLFF
jgi:hypothetical protein